MCAPTPLHLLLPLLFPTTTCLPLVPSCVEVTLVRGKGDLDGLYRLLGETTKKREEVCQDGCIYSKVVMVMAHHGGSDGDGAPWW